MAPADTPVLGNSTVHCRSALQTVRAFPASGHAMCRMQNSPFNCCGGWRLFLSVCYVLHPAHLVTANDPHRSVHFCFHKTSERFPHLQQPGFLFGPWKGNGKGAYTDDSAAPAAKKQRILACFSVF